MDARWSEIDQMLRREHRLRPGEEADFNIRDQASLLSTVQETTQTFSLLLAGIAAISLLVGGIGIMNIMLVSVTERTREIGLRKALGARRQRHPAAVPDRVAGAVPGRRSDRAGCWASGGSYALERLAGWNIAVAPESVALAFAFSAAVGVFFGLWPAPGAAALVPIEALRYE